MNSRFTERAQRVILIAQDESKRLNHDYCGTEHMLLGLIALSEGIATQVLSNLGVDLRMVRSEIEKIVGQGDNVILLGEIPFTPRAKKVLELAVEEAQNLGHSYVGTEHLLLGLIREEEGIAAQVLDNLGIKLDIAREEVLNLLNENPMDKPLNFSPKSTTVLKSKVAANPIDVAVFVLDRLYVLAKNVKDEREFKNRAEELLHIYAETQKFK